MRTNWLAILAATALTATGASPAAGRPNTSTNTADQATASAATGKAEKKICRRIEHTGSRLAKKACHTAEEWKKIDAAEF